MVCRVIVKSGPGLGCGCVVADADAVEFGRMESNDCVLANDAAISRRHFQIYFKDETCWITDLNSRNGTFVNSLPVASSKLTNGDEILVGNTRLLVRLDNRPAGGMHPDLMSSKSADPVAADEHLLSRFGRGKKSPEAGKKTEEIAGSFERLDLSVAGAEDQRFCKLLGDLPGIAFLFDATELAPHLDSLSKEIERVQVSQSVWLLFPTQVGQIKDLARLILEDRGMILSFRSRRSHLAARARLSQGVFGRPSVFWSEFSQLPQEVIANHLAGIDFVIAEYKRRNTLRVLYRTDFDPTIVKELVSLSDLSPTP